MMARTLMAIAILTVALSVAGCGRKSGLETPYEAAVEARKAAEKAKEPLPPEPTPPVKDRRFILDGLI